jgi:anti-sigma B factor antagonist
MTDPGPLMRAEVEDGRVLVRLSGEVDLSNVEGLEAQIEDTVADARDVVIDLTAIEFIDSRGLRLLNRVASSVDGRDGTLVVVAPPNCVARSVLDMTGMSQELKVRDSL